VRTPVAAGMIAIAVLLLKAPVLTAPETPGVRPRQAGRRPRGLVRTPPASWGRSMP